MANINKLTDDDVFSGSTPPPNNINPKKTGSVYVDSNTGKVYTCKDNTPNKNIWILLSNNKSESELTYRVKTGCFFVGRRNDTSRTIWDTWNNARIKKGGNSPFNCLYAKQDLVALNLYNLFDIPTVGTDPYLFNGYLDVQFSEHYHVTYTLPGIDDEQKRNISKYGNSGEILEVFKYITTGWLGLNKLKRNFEPFDPLLKKVKFRHDDYASNNHTVPNVYNENEVIINTINYNSNYGAAANYQPDSLVYRWVDQNSWQYSLDTINTVEFCSLVKSMWRAALPNAAPYSAEHYKNLQLFIHNVMHDKIYNGDQGHFTVWITPTTSLLFRAPLGEVFVKFKATLYQSK